MSHMWTKQLLILGVYISIYPVATPLTLDNTLYSRKIEYLVYSRVFCDVLRSQEKKTVCRGNESIMFTEDNALQTPNSFPHSDACDTGVTYVLKTDYYYCEILFTGRMPLLSPIK